MMKKNRFWLIVVLMTVANLADAISTYYVSPSLEYEGNRWVEVLHLNFWGLMVVLVIYQVLYTLPLWFRCFRYRKSYLYIEAGKGFLFWVKHFFWNQNEDANVSFKGKMAYLFGRLLDFLSFFLPLYYISQKIIMSVGNWIVGYFLRHVNVTGKNGTMLDIVYNKEEPFWNTLQGKFSLFYMSCSPNEKIGLQSLPLTVIMYLLPVVYLFINYRISLGLHSAAISPVEEQIEYRFKPAFFCLLVTCFIIL